MKIRLELTQEDLVALVCQELERKFGSEFNKMFVRVEVKSKQNYKSEWESADFRAIFEKSE